MLHEPLDAFGQIGPRLARPALLAGQHRELIQQILFALDIAPGSRDRQHPLQVGFGLREPSQRIHILSRVDEDRTQTMVIRAEQALALLDQCLVDLVRFCVTLGLVQGKGVPFTNTEALVGVEIGRSRGEFRRPAKVLGGGLKVSEVGGNACEKVVISRELAGLGGSCRGI